MNRIAVVLLPLALTTVAVGARAFPFLRTWADPADGNDSANAVRAGGGLIYATGSAQDYGIRCSDCHVRSDADPPSAIDAQFVITPGWQDVGGDPGYKPGDVYHIEINMLGEHLGPGPKANNNSIAVVIEDMLGHRAGDYISDSPNNSSMNCTAGPPPDNATLLGHSTYVYADCHGVLSTQLPDANSKTAPLTQWTFDWVAPPAGKGDVTIFWGMVDGDGGELGADGLTSLNDDVKEGTIVLVEGS